MDCLSNVDLRKALMDIAQCNTFYHLDNDIKISFDNMEQVAKMGDMSEKSFVWVSYPSGIDCYSEREVFQKDTRGYNGVLYHGAGAEREPKLAYVVEVWELKEGSIYGNIYEIDIQKYAEAVRENAVPSNAMRLYLGNLNDIDKQVVMPLDEFNKRYPLDLPKMEYWRNEPADQDALKAVTAKVWDSGLLSMDSIGLWEHINKLDDRRLDFHAAKLISGINSHKEPNSPDKQSFTTTLDAYVANNFGTEQLSKLLDKLPYENAAFAVQKGNRWNMNLVIPKNEVLALRQDRSDKPQKPSIIGTLEANEQKVKQQFGNKSTPGKDSEKNNKESR